MFAGALYVLTAVFSMIEAGMSKPKEDAALCMQKHYLQKHFIRGSFDKKKLFTQGIGQR
jgi:hypothetical protein